MKDSAKLKSIIESVQMSTAEFATEIGLGNAQNLYNILWGKYGISKKVARMIANRFPEIISYEDIISTDVVIHRKHTGTSIEALESDINFDTEQKFERENKKLKEKIKWFEEELEVFRKREKNWLTLIDKLEKEIKPEKKVTHF